MLEVDYLWNGSVKNDGVNANLLRLPNFKYPRRRVARNLQWLGLFWKCET